MSGAFIVRDYVIRRAAMGGFTARHVRFGPEVTVVAGEEAARVALVTWPSWETARDAVLATYRTPGGAP